MKTFIKLSFLFLLILSTVFIVCSGDDSLRIPLKPKNIPKESFWKGGVDGGLWYFFDKKKGNKYEVYMYFVSGELYEKNSFVLIGNLVKQVKLSDQFYEYGVSYIFLTNRSYFKKLNYNYSLQEKEFIKYFQTNKDMKF